MNRALVVAIILMAVSAHSHSVLAEQVEAQGDQGPAIQQNGLYSYDINDAPEYFFFPKEKARWDGSQVTMREWYMLTDAQKEKFITEYLEELQGKYRMSIDVMGMDYLKALNIFSAYSNDRTMREPSTKFIDILLSGQGKLSGKDSPKSGAQ